MPQDDASTWALLLQRWPEMCQPAEILPIAARLLCCSQAMAVIVHQNCTGRLPASFHAARRPASSNTACAAHGRAQLRQFQAKSQHLASWLRKHEALLSSLAINMTPGQPSDQHQPHHASHLPGSPGRVEEPPCGLLSPVAPPSSLSSTAAAAWHQLWQLLPSARAPAVPIECLTLSCRTLLTELHWSVGSSDCTPRAPFLRALPALQHLNTLGLHCLDTGAGVGSLAALAPALQALTQVTHLSLQGFSISTSSARLLPSSIVELYIGPPLDRLLQQEEEEEDTMPGWRYSHVQQQQPLHIQHLTRLRRLQLHRLCGCDVVPAEVTSLCVGPCSAIALAPLTQLQRMYIEADAPELLLMVLATQLRQLQQVQLSCRGTWLTPGALKHMCTLPLTRLHIHDELPHHLLPSLGRCTQPTDLALQLQEVQDTTQDSLAAQLGALTGLQALSLSLQAPREPGLYDIAAVAVGIAEAAAMESEACEPVAATDSLVAAVLGLPQLHSLRLQGVVLSAKQQAQLAAAMQLTVLQ